MAPAASGSTATSGRGIRFVVPLFLCLAVFVTIVATIEDYGLTRDEPYYIENARAIEYWLSHAAEPGAFTYAALKEYWRSGLLDDNLSGNVHPPFFKLSAIAFRHLLGTRIFDSIPFQYRVSTAFWSTMLVLSLFLLARRFTGSSTWGLLAGLSFIAVPRFFAEAHLFTTDMMVSALGFCALSAFILPESSRTRILLAGLLSGAALATKFTGILALAVIGPLIVIADDRCRFLRDYALMALVACAFFCLFNLPVLFNPGDELRFYFSNFFDREKLLPIPTLYFGSIYGFRLPFHQPWVMLGITLPPLTVLAAMLGMPSSARRCFMRHDRLAFLALVPFLCCMAAYMLPSTPKYDGIRLFSSSWPFIILLGLNGCRRLQEWLPQRFRAGMLLSAAALSLSLYQLTQHHPLQLSYYSSFIGGTKGADRNGFTVAYWPDGFNREFFRKASELLGDSKGKIYLYPPSSMVTYNKAYGLFDTQLENTADKDDDYGYLLVHNWNLTYEMLDFLASRKKLLEVRAPDGTFIGGLFENK